ncbi:MAG: 2-C-methyl-D-erythritol 2,4-cyclodiphosphate synthase [Candidatus Izemoplasmatales bacterium]|nr:2-C-methyl-D-erythritol 2,4-cyclodiphosphate synthase [Candidatus Izemoplasmatales bacterium]
MYKIGFSKDVHRLEEGRPFILGGVTLDHYKGAVGHSDADCLVHAISESILGALALGDLGKFFPDTDPRYRNYNSLLILKEIWEYAKGKGFDLINLDAMVSLEQPKLRPFVDQMRQNIAETMQVPIDKISIKATTYEGLSFVGHEEGIICEAICLLEHELMY